MIMTWNIYMAIKMEMAITMHMSIIIVRKLIRNTAMDMGIIILMSTGD